LQFEGILKISNIKPFSVSGGRTLIVSGIAYPPNLEHPFENPVYGPVLILLVCTINFDLPETGVLVMHQKTHEQYNMINL